MDSLLITEQYENMLEIARDTQKLISEDKSQINLQLGKQVLDKIHELRYKMAYNKATDFGDFDFTLKKAHQSLNELIKP